MDDVVFLWDLDDDPDGNVCHLAEHGISKDDAEHVILTGTLAVSRRSGLSISFADAADGRHLAVVWEHVDDNPLIVRPVTAYEVPRKRRRG